MKPTLEFHFGAAFEKDLDEILALLVQCGLPVRGVAECLGDAVVARAGGFVVAVAAVEPHAPYGLLRSVAVAAEHRGKGLAHELCERCAKQSSDAHLDALYLLTETAAPVFTVLGYREIARADVPDVIRLSEEFSEICPESAIVMMRSLIQSSKP